VFAEALVEGFYVILDSVVGTPILFAHLQTAVITVHIAKTSDTMSSFIPSIIRKDKNEVYIQYKMIGDSIRNDRQIMPIIRGVALCRTT
jgi:hypothetical protein